MKESNHTNVQFVKKNFPLKVIWIYVHIAAVHEEKQPHKCSICAQKFSRKGDMNHHIDSVHEEKRPNKCQICEKTFSQKGHLNYHITSVHEGNLWWKVTWIYTMPMFIDLFFL